MSEIPSGVCVGLFIIIVIICWRMISRPEPTYTRDRLSEDRARARASAKLELLQQQHEKESRQWARTNRNPVDDARDATTDSSKPGRYGFREMDGLFEKTLADYKKRGLLRNLFGVFGDSDE